jgi:hypothetical protein
MHHRVIERVDAAEIFGVQGVLCADLVGRFGAEISLKKMQNRPQDREARKP